MVLAVEVVSVGALVASSGWDSSKSPADARLLWWSPRAVQAMGWHGLGRCALPVQLWRLFAVEDMVLRFRV